MKTRICWIDPRALSRELAMEYAKARLAGVGPEALREMRREWISVRRVRQS